MCSFRSRQLLWTLVDWDYGIDQEAQGQLATLDLQDFIDFYEFWDFKVLCEWVSLKPVIFQWILREKL